MDESSSDKISRLHRELHEERRRVERIARILESALHDTAGARETLRDPRVRRDGGTIVRWTADHTRELEARRGHEISSGWRGVPTAPADLYVPTTSAREYACETLDALEAALTDALDLLCE